MTSTHAAALGNWSVRAVHMMAESLEPPLTASYIKSSCMQGKRTQLNSIASNNCNSKS